MKWLGKCSGKLYSEEEFETMPECGISVNDSEAEDPAFLKELHEKESLDCASCRACPMYVQKLIEEAADEWDKAMTEMKKLSLMCCGSYEIEYQQKHKKVKDRKECTSPWGNHTIELSKEEIYALLSGETLGNPNFSEYGLFIKMEDQTND